MITTFKKKAANANAMNCFFNPSHSYLDHLTVIELNKSGGEDHQPTTHTKSERILTTSALFLLQGADNEGGFGLIPALFLLQEAGD